MLTQSSKYWFEFDDPVDVISQWGNGDFSQHLDGNCQPTSKYVKWKAGDFLLIEDQLHEERLIVYSLGFDKSENGKGRGAWIELKDGWGWFDVICGPVNVLQVNPMG